MESKDLLALSETFSQPFGSLDRVRRTLKRLEAARQVHSWRYATTGESGGAAPFYYKLTLDGYRTLHQSEIAMPPTKRYLHEIGVGRHQHQRSLTSYVVKTHVAAHRSGLRIIDSYPENTFRIETPFGPLFPDRRFTIALPAGGHFTNCVELDNSTRVDRLAHGDRQHRNEDCGSTCMTSQRPVTRIACSSSSRAPAAAWITFWNSPPGLQPPIDYSPVLRRVTSTTILRLAVPFWSRSSRLPRNRAHCTSAFACGITTGQAPAQVAGATGNSLLASAACWQARRSDGVGLLLTTPLRTGHALPSESRDTTGQTPPEIHAHSTAGVLWYPAPPILIAISDTPANERGPRHTKPILAAIHKAASRRSPVSFVFARHAESVGLYVRFPDNLASLVKGQFYAKYPDCEIEQLADDVLDTPQACDAWSLELRLRPDLFPIIRYQQYEDADAGRNR